MELVVGQVWGRVDPESWLKVKSFNFSDTDLFDSDQPEGVILQRTSLDNGTFSWISLDLLEYTKAEFLAFLKTQDLKLMGYAPTSAPMSPLDLQKDVL